MWSKIMKFCEHKVLVVYIKVLQLHMETIAFFFFIIVYTKIRKMVFLLEIVKEFWGLTCIG